MRVIIIDDHALFRDGLKGLLEQRNIDVAGVAADKPSNDTHVQDHIRELFHEGEMLGKHATYVIVLGNMAIDDCIISLASVQNSLTGTVWLLHT